MKALCWHGTEDVRVDTVPDPTILNDRDCIIKVTRTAICGSDLHLYDGYIPTMQAGDVLGHEFMGEVVETGKSISTLKTGDRVVIPFPISCGSCHHCQRTEFSLCDNSNPNAEMLEAAYGYAGAGLFGYSHMMGGYAGGQAEYARVPYADVGPYKVPETLTDDQVLFLTDIFPTGYMAAENCGSDLHLYDGYIPTMQAGDVLGHEFMGEVVETGKNVSTLKKGDRVVVPFTIACGSCRHMLARTSGRSATTRGPQRGDARSGLRLLGLGPLRLLAHDGRLRRRAGRVRPRALRRRRPVQGARVAHGRPWSSSSPTSSRRATRPPRTAASRKATSWPCGAAGQSACSPRSARSMMGATRHRHRPLSRAPRHGRALRRLGDAQHTSDAFGTCLAVLRDDDSRARAGRYVIGGRRDGGARARARRRPTTRSSRRCAIETDRAYALRQAIQACGEGRHGLGSGRLAGRLPSRSFNIGRGLRQGPDVQDGPDARPQVPAEAAQAHRGRSDLDPSFIITHRAPLERAPELYKTFRDKQDFLHQGRPRPADVRRASVLAAGAGAMGARAARSARAAASRSRGASSCSPAAAGGWGCCSRGGSSMKARTWRCSRGRPRRTSPRPWPRSARAALAVPCDVRDRDGRRGRPIAVCCRAPRAAGRCSSTTPA